LGVEVNLDEMMSILPDLLQSNLKVIFCGTAAGTMSAQLGAYYANPGNKFWRVLYETGLTPRLFAPQEFPILPQYGIGLTDLAQHTFGNDSDLRPHDFDAEAFRTKMLHYTPRAIAFNSKRAAQEFFRQKTIGYGQQPEMLGNSAIFVLPSTSGLACRSWDPIYWHELATFLST
jgi:TDG/mug DNA glycosylase family protein